MDRRVCAAGAAVLVLAGGGLVGCEPVRSTPATDRTDEATGRPSEEGASSSTPTPTETKSPRAENASAQKTAEAEEEAEPAPRPSFAPEAAPAAAEKKARSSPRRHRRLRRRSTHGGGGGAVGAGGAGYGRAAPMGLMRGGSAARPRDGLAALRDPAQRPNREGYDHDDPNPFIRVADEPLSTFSADVDTASYSNIRRFLGEGRLPPASAVRVEEMLNYFRYDYPEPSADRPFGIQAEVGPCPWAPEHRLVHLGLRTQAIPTEDLPPRNLVFLIDVSGSMRPANKLPLLRRAMALLANQLRPQDRVALVVYAGASGLVLPSTSGERRQEILSALEQLEAGGSTNGGAGIELAYRTAEEHRVEGGINRVVLATDGDFNVGVSSRGELARLIEKKRETGTYLTVLGFGTGNIRDGTMEMLADKGNGNYAYIDSLAEARKVLVREAGATLATVADDVKLQVELNPEAVATYRLLGYENRLLAARDFNDDEKDAGEVGAGHMVTVLYEVVPPGAADDGAPKIDPLRYQSDREPTSAASGQELLTLKIRYKAPGEPESKLLTRPVGMASQSSASRSLRFAAAVAGFGLWLRDDPHWDSPGLASLERIAAEALGSDPAPERRELLSLMRKAWRLAKAKQDPRASR